MNTLPVSRSRSGRLVSSTTRWKPIAYQMPTIGPTRLIGGQGADEVEGLDADLGEERRQERGDPP